jgi:hypothetical protein
MARMIMSLLTSICMILGRCSYKVVGPALEQKKHQLSSFARGIAWSHHYSCRMIS